MRRYLAEFLSDPRVIEIPPLAWKPILHGIILRTRPQQVGACLQPGVDQRRLAARASSRSARREALRERLGPSVERRLCDALRQSGHRRGDRATWSREGCTRILAAPLYPQYCAATTATANDAVFAALARMRWQPALRTLPPYYDDPLYIDALRGQPRRASSRRSISSRERLLLSFHGMPQRTLELGDPYHCHCQKTARLLGEALGREVDVAFQSRFGRAKWLEPATDATLAGLSGAGRQAHRHRRAGLFRRLPRDAGGARHPRPRDVPARRRRAFRAARLPQRFARRHRPCSNALIAPRTCRLAAADISAPPAEQRRESWLEWRSSPAARAALARRSASRSRTWA